MDRFQENLFCSSSTTTNQESINNCSIATRKMCLELLQPVGGMLREMEQVKGKITPHWYRQCLWLLNEKKTREHFAIKEQCQKWCWSQCPYIAFKGQHYPTAIVEKIKNWLPSTTTFTTRGACGGYWKNARWRKKNQISNTQHTLDAVQILKPRIYQREMDQLYAGDPVEITVGFVIHNERISVILLWRWKRGLKSWKDEKLCA